MDVLMLDLEGVLIWSALYPKTLKPWPAETLSAVRRQEALPVDHSFDGRENVRPYAPEFLYACAGIFDEIWMNTCVDWRRTDDIMHDWFGFLDHRYWAWGDGRKTLGYERFSKDTLIHVEDGISPVERDDIARLGMHYVPVSSYHPLLAQRPPSLEDALRSIRAILGSAVSSEASGSASSSRGARS